MKRYNCEVIRDLLPLYEDGCCSKESKNIVEIHLAECSECRQSLREMQLPFLGGPAVVNHVPEQTLKNGMRKVRQFLRRSLTIALAIMIAAAGLFFLWQFGSSFFNRRYEVDYSSKCFFREYTGNGYAYTRESEFQIAGFGRSKRFSTELGRFSGKVEVAACPLPFADNGGFYCKVYDDLVLITNHGANLTNEDIQYIYMVYISPKDPDICVIFISDLYNDTDFTIVCADSTEEAAENYPKFNEAYENMCRNG